MNLSGESFSETPYDPKEFLETLNRKIQFYGPKNVFNGDETGLFYKSICTKQRSNFKQIKDKISVFLCANMKGTEKLKPLVLGKFNKPRCFKNFDVSKHVEYIATKKAWVTADSFNLFL